MSKEKRILVQIVGNHPHAGERGYILVVDDKVTIEYPAGVSVGMVLVKLEDCKHGTNGCYAEQKNMRLL